MGDRPILRPRQGLALSLDAVRRHVLRLGRLDLLVHAMVLNGLAFLNTWGFPSRGSSSSVATHGPAGPLLPS